MNVMGESALQPCIASYNILITISVNACTDGSIRHGS